MDFNLNQDKFLEISHSILQKQQNRLEKIKALCDFIVLEEGLTPDDEAIAGQVLRQLIWLAQQCINEFKIICKELAPEEEIFFGICDCSLEDAANGVLAIYGYSLEDSQTLTAIPSMKSLPRFVNSNERMILVLDVYRGASLIPWSV